MPPALFLKCVIKNIKGGDAPDSAQDIADVPDEILELKGFIAEIEDWLKTADIPEDVRKFIVEKTELFKKKKRNKG